MKLFYCYNIIETYFVNNHFTRVK